MKTQVNDNRLNTTATEVWYDDELSEYILIDKETGDWFETIYDGDYLNDEGDVDYDSLYTAIENKILGFENGIEVEDYYDETPKSERAYDVYYTNGTHEAYATLECESAKEAFKLEQQEIDEWNAEGCVHYRITKIHYV